MQVRNAYEKVKVDRNAGIDDIERFISEYILKRVRMAEVGLIISYDPVSESYAIVTMRHKMANHELLEWVGERSYRAIRWVDSDNPEDLEDTFFGGERAKTIHFVSQTNIFCQMGQNHFFCFM